MSIPGSVSPLFFGAGAGEAAGFQIDRSLRFTSGDSASLTRTPSSAGNRKTWTWSCWVKRSALGTRQMIFGNITSSGNGPGLNVEFQADDKIQIVDYNSGYDTRRITTQVFRDPSAFYHIVVVYDTTNATAGDRIRLYVNGARITDLSSVTNPSQNFDGYFNTAQQHAIGTSGALGSLYLSAYIAEVNFVDGTALDESDFGEYDSNNVWQAKDTSGLTFGTNGFRLKFDDNSSNAALGNDSSGNDNDWTVNNLTAVAVDNNWADYVYASDSTYDSTATGTNFFTGAGSQENLFDGSTSTQVGSVNANMAWVYFRPATAITGVTSLRIWGSYNSTTKINGTDYQESPAWSSTPQWVSVPSPPSSITEIAIQGSAARISAIEVNGAVLVDPTPASAIDSLIDTPTNYTADSGNNGGNYATLNPLDSAATLKNGNLDTDGDANYYDACASIGLSSGKWYFEAVASSIGDGGVGITRLSNSGLSHTAVDSFRTIYQASGGIYRNGTGIANTTGLSTYGVGDVISVALDLDNGTIAFRKNNTLINSTTNSVYEGATNSWKFYVLSQNTDWSVNFGQRPFAYTPPSDHLAVCTTNLPNPTIADGSTAFDVALWTGNGSSAQTISTPNLSPDMVWFKERSNTSSHAIIDAVRGSTNAAKVIYPDRTDAEITANQYQSITSLNSDGFTIGSSDNSINQSSQTYVGWAWDAGSSTVSNTDGSITSSVRANQSAGFSIVSYTGNGTLNATVGHGLNATPTFRLTKRRDGTDNWVCNTTAIDGSHDYAHLNLTNAFSHDGVNSPTSSVFSVGTHSSVNTNGNTYVCYCYTPVEGYSAFGSYTGLGGSEGPFVALSFRPAWLMVKSSSTSGGSWVIYDNARGTYNLNNAKLAANLNGEENNSTLGGTSLGMDFLSNGFKYRGDGGDNHNGTNYTYLYVAFAEHPFKTARAR